MDKTLTNYDKIQLDQAIDQAIVACIENGKWNGNKFCLVVKPDFQEIAFDYIKKSLQEKASDDAAKILLNQIIQNSSNQTKSDSDIYSSNSLYDNSIFEFITEVKPYNPSTKIEFRFKFDTYELEEGVEDALKKIKDKSNISFFPQLADVTDKDSNDGYNLSKIQDLRSFIDSTKNKNLNFTNQENALIYNFDLALRRSLKVAELLGDSNKVSEINSILGRSEQETWKNAKSQNIFNNITEVNGTLKISNLVILAPYNNDTSKTRDSASANEFTITRENKEFSFGLNNNISFAGIRLKVSGKIEDPKGIYKDHREKSIAEIKEITDAVKTLKPKSQAEDLFSGFNKWAQNSTNKDNDKINDPKAEVKNQQEIKKTTPKRSRDNVSSKKEGKPSVKEESEINHPNFKRVSLNYKGLDMREPDFQKEVGIQNDPKYGLFANAMLNMYKFLATPVRTLIYLGKEVTYGVSKIDENTDINKKTVENLSKKLDEYIKKINPENPNLDHFELAMITLSTRGGYSEDKFNSIIAEKEGNIKNELLDLFSKKIDATDFEDKIKGKLINEFQGKLNNTLVISTFNKSDKLKDARNSGSISFSEPSEDKTTKQVLDESLLAIANNKLNNVFSRISSAQLSPENKLEIINKFIENQNPSILANFSIEFNGEKLSVKPNNTIETKNLNEIIKFIDDNILNKSGGKGFTEEFNQTKSAYVAYIRLAETFKEYNADKIYDPWEKNNIERLTSKLETELGLSNIKLEENYGFSVNGISFNPSFNKNNATTSRTP